MKTRLTGFLTLGGVGILIIISGFFAWRFWWPLNQWNVYRNESYGFEIRYPNKYIVKEKKLRQEELIVFFTLKESILAEPVPNIRIFLNKNTSQAVNELRSNSTLKVTKEENINIDGGQGEKISARDLVHDLSLVFIVVEKNNYLYQMSEVSDRMLTTFRFLK